MYQGVDLAVVKLQNTRGLPTAFLLERELNPDGESVVAVAHQLAGRNDFKKILVQGGGAPANFTGFYDPNYPNLREKDLYSFAFGDTRDNSELIFAGISGAGLFTQDGKLAGLVKGQEHALSQKGIGVLGIALKSTMITQLLLE